MHEAPPAASPIGTHPVDRAEARRIEAAEGRAWADCYAAAPPDLAESIGVSSLRVGGATVLSWAASGRRYFSRTIGLGVSEPVTPEALDAIIGGWEEQGIEMFLLQSLPHCRPAEYEGWLRDRGLEPFDVQDRVVRGDRPLRSPSGKAGERELAAERVTRDSADEWAEFLQRVYQLETRDWLQRLVGRRGWHPYAVREEGTIVGARTMFIGPDGYAWWGMDGPVPGLTTQDYEPDAALCEFMVTDGLANGARVFLADIEVPSEAMDTPAYDYFARLGFGRPYSRTHYARL